MSTSRSPQGRGRKVGVGEAGREGGLRRRAGADGEQTCRSEPRRPKPHQGRWTEVASTVDLGTQRPPAPTAKCTRGAPRPRPMRGHPRPGSTAPRSRGNVANQDQSARGQEFRSGRTGHTRSRLPLGSRSRDRSTRDSRASTHSAWCAAREARWLRGHPRGSAEGPGRTAQKARTKHAWGREMEGRGSHREFELCGALPASGKRPPRGGSQAGGRTGPDAGKGLGNPKSVSEAPLPAMGSLECTPAPSASSPRSSQLLRP